MLLPLKDILKERTNGVIKFFMSSDGQSIRIGTNWNAELEAALTRTSIMFVFVTPNSIDSKWVHFEAGYCYSKGISVIPIGLNDIDIGKISEPLRLLQGFNLKDYSDLSNIVTHINDEYDCEFDTHFDHKPINKLFNTQNYNLNHIHVIYIKLTLDNDIIKYQNEIENMLKGILVLLSNEEYWQGPGIKVTLEKNTVTLEIRPYKYLSHLSLVNSLINKLKHHITDNRILVFVNSDCEISENELEITSIADDYDYEVTDSIAHVLVYKNLLVGTSYSYHIDNVNHHCISIKPPNGQALNQDLLYIADSFEKAGLILPT